MGGGGVMRTVVILAVAFFMIGSENFHVATAQVCGANLSGLMNECQRYISNAGPPSRSCCALIRPIDVPCACRYVSRDVTNYIDMDKVVYVARSCGKKIPSGYKCGSYTILKA
ncbi:hypothetical protein CARUB_v10006065mg [Capsella rubella]|uniref:Bifunctional inhibitor/plant lipid transfer protein/seed storage helical domain-containing protein n=1 Tax=Capsella rubella TaxID=81985 RepID=R0GLC8_9BRAS|nr:uncharacterized protein LOC17880322 [Capsella rubella]EOA17694.1 hypothetical protein CARUB_v10006065mg [Capsella rubella]